MIDFRGLIPGLLVIGAALGIGLWELIVFLIHHVHIGWR